MIVAFPRYLHLYFCCCHTATGNIDDCYWGPGIGNRHLFIYNFQWSFALILFSMATGLCNCLTITGKRDLEASFAHILF